MGPRDALLALGALGSYLLAHLNRHTIKKMVV